MRSAPWSLSCWPLQTENAIAPGAIMMSATEGSPRHIGDDRGKAGEALVAPGPLTLFGKPKQVAAVVAFLLSGANGSINGGVVTIDGEQLYKKRGQLMAPKRMVADHGTRWRGRFWRIAGILTLVTVAGATLSRGRQRAPREHSPPRSIPPTGWIRSAGPDGMRDKPQRPWTVVDQASDESFPASDPPGYR